MNRGRSIALHSWFGCWLLMLIVASVNLRIVCADEFKTAGAATSVQDPSLLELVLLGEQRTLRIVLRVTIDDLPLGTRWNTAYKNLFTYFDRDANGVLGPTEADRMPTAFAMRQLLWGQWGPAVAVNQRQRVIATDRQSIDADALAEAYSRVGAGAIVVAAGKPQASESLTAAILRQIDENRDGQSSAAEWRGAERRLLQLDRDDDELIEPDDLLAGSRYPAASGSLVVDPPRAGRPVNSEVNSLPIIVLPAQLNDFAWTTELVRRLDREGDGQLSGAEAHLPADVFASLDSDGNQMLDAGELSHWRRMPADRSWTVRCSPLGHPHIDPVAGVSIDEDATADAQQVELVEKKLCFQIRGDSGKLAELNTAARLRFEAAFGEVDADDDGTVTTTELEKKNLEEIARLFAVADRDADGQLSAMELRAWLDLTAELANNQVLLTLLDFGPSLFELLDADRDGGLSVRELRGAWDQLSQSHCVVDGRFETTSLPRRLSAIVSRGQPQSLLATPLPRGPAWFRAMDRNHDGALSAREFLGTRAQFLRYDHDRDGLLDITESAALSALQRAGEEFPESCP